MATHRTMLFDHCVITFSVEDESDRHVHVDAQSCRLTTRRHGEWRAVGRVCLVLALASLVLLVRF